MNTVEKIIKTALKLKAYQIKIESIALELKIFFRMTLGLSLLAYDNNTVTRFFFKLCLYFHPQCHFHQLCFFIDVSQFAVIMHHAIN